MSRKHLKAKTQAPEALSPSASTQAPAPDVQPIPDAQPSVPVSPDVKVVKAKKSKHARLSEAQIIERYPHVIPGTLKYELEGPHANKQTVLAKMTCGHEVRLATSDLFQIHVCKDCRKAARKTNPGEKADGTVKAPKTKVEKEQHAKANAQAVSEAHPVPEPKPAMASARMPSADARKAALANQ